MTDFEIVVVGTGDNRFSMLMESELLDRLAIMREINSRFMATALGDIDSWQPVGILNAGPVIHYDHESQNAQAVEWWRSQRRQPMNLDEAMAKVRTEYGTALELLGRL